MSAAWMETWIQDRLRPSQVFGDEGLHVADFECGGHERAHLAAAAPKMARTLLKTEWAGRIRDFGETYSCCPSCDAFAPGPDYGGSGRHEPRCDHDAALTAAGFPDQASREAAREAIRKAGM